MKKNLRRVESPGGCRPERRRRAPRSCACGRRLGRLAFALLLALYAAASHPSSSLARLQTPTPPETLSAFPNPLVIDLTRSPSETLQFSMGEKFPEGSYPIDIKGDGKKWWLVQFEKVTPGVSFRVRDTVKGYNKGQPMPQGTWFPIREHLPVVMVIGQTTTAAPMSFHVRTGSLDEHAQGEVQNYTARELMDYVSAFRNSPRLQESGFYGVELHYGGIMVVPPTPQSTPPTPTPTPQEATSSGYWSYLIVPGIFLLLLGIVLAIKLLRRGRTTEEEMPPPAADTRVRTGNVTTYSSKDKGRSGGARSASAGSPSGASAATSSGASAATPSASRSETLEPNAVNLQVGGGAPAQGAGSDDIRDVRGELSRLWEALGKKETAEAEELSRLIDTLTGEKISASATSLRREIKEQHEHFVNEQKILRAEVKKEIGDAKAELKGVIGGVRDGVGPAVEARISAVEEAWEASTSSLRDENGRVAARIEQVERETLANAERLYNARVLGFMLENHVDVLCEGNFNQLMVELKERLERFFREEVGRDGDGSLRGLQERAGAISEAFQAVVAKLSELSADGDGRARRLADRVEGTAAEMGRLGTQLEEKQLDLAANVHIPVSAHAHARRTFLEELGLAIQREVANLSDPLVHFENELERLATSEVVGLADICDRQFPPGANPELEERLKRLFELAGVDDIVPVKDGPFETGRQELLGMVDGRPQDSLKVAQVFSRGFIYKQDGTLLRKAGVKVYR